MAAKSSFERRGLMRKSASISLVLTFVDSMRLPLPRPIALFNFLTVLLCPATSPVSRLFAKLIALKLSRAMDLGWSKILNSCSTRRGQTATVVHFFNTIYTALKELRATDFYLSLYDCTITLQNLKSMFVLLRQPGSYCGPQLESVKAGRGQPFTIAVFVWYFLLSLMYLDTMFHLDPVFHQKVFDCWSWGTCCNAQVGFHFKCLE